MTADQLILTKEGYKPIIDIKVGDMVLTKSGEWHPVVKFFDNGVHPTCYLKLMDGPTVHCTYNHKFWAMEIDIDKLEKDMNTAANAPRFTQVSDMKFGHLVCVHRPSEEDEFGYMLVESIEPAGLEHVYNIEVETDHSYIVNGMVSKNCTDFSNAGKQAGGTEGSGTRSSILWYTRNAIIEKRPKFLMMENVKALVSDKFLPTFRKWEQELAGYGYQNFRMVMNAKDYGVPQNRERIFCISILSDTDAHFHFPEPFELKLRLKDMLEPKVDEKYYLSDDKVQSFVEHCDKKQAEGCGFKFEPTVGGGVSKDNNQPFGNEGDG